MLLQQDYDIELREKPIQTKIDTNAFLVVNARYKPVQLESKVKNSVHIHMGMQINAFTAYFDGLEARVTTSTLDAIKNIRGNFKS